MTQEIVSDWFDHGVEYGFDKMFIIRDSLLKEVYPTYIISEKMQERMSGLKSHQKITLVFNLKNEKESQLTLSEGMI